MRRHVGIAAALALSAGTALVGQAPPPVLTFVAISGRVLTADGHQPIANARVVVPRSSPDRPFVFTDDEGRFTLAAPANSLLTVSKAGYNSQSIAGRGSPLPDVLLLQSASISGRVVATNGEPVFGARVVLELVQAPASNANGVAASPGADLVLAANTDDRGEYRIAPAPLVPFRVQTVVRTALATRVTPDGVRYTEPVVTRVYFPGVADAADAQVFQLRPADEQTAVDFLAPQQPASDAIGPLPPRQLPRGTSSLSGRAISTDGRPLEGVLISVSSSGTEGISATSSPDGTFALRDLPAGILRVVGERRGYFNTIATGNQAVAGRRPNITGLELAEGERRQGLVLQLQRTLTVSGQVLDEHNEPLRGVSVQALQLRYVSGLRRLVPNGPAALTDDRGAYRLWSLPPGSYLVSGTTGGVTSPGVGGYAPSYYPATNEPAQAAWVSLDQTDDADGIDIAMSRAQTFTISGQMFNASGLPSGNGRLELTARSRSSLVANNSVGARISPDGRFEFPNVTPGEYVIQAGNGRKDGATEGEFVALPVSVGNTDITGVILRLSRGSDVSAHATFDGRPDTRLQSGFPMELTSISSDPDLAPPGLAAARLGPNGLVAIHGLSGPRRLVVANLPDAWMLKEIRAGGVDITDAAVMFGEPNQSLTDVEIALTSRVTALTGTVVDERMAPAEGVRVIVFPLDRTLWMPASRFVRRTTSDRNGRFFVKGLPADSYYVAAAQDTPPLGAGAWQDPEYLDTLIGRAATITLSEGQETTATLRVRSQ